MSSVITPKKLFESRNTDDILVRNVTGGLLSILNNRLSYKQVWDDQKNDVEKITIPFFFNLGNPASEDFIQDNYLFFGDDCFNKKKINGNFDVIPRGMLNLSSCTTRSESITNRWVMGEYMKQDPDTGKYEYYVSYLYSLPLLITYPIEIRCSRFVEKLKIDQACREFFYKNKTFHILYKGMNVPCRAGFPDSFGGETQTNYTMGTNTQADLKLNFEIQVETYHPIFDPSTEMKSSNKIHAFSSSIDYSYPDKNDVSLSKMTNNVVTGINFTNGSNNSIYTIDASNDIRYPSNAAYTFLWNTIENKKDITSIKIEYSDSSILNENDIINNISPGISKLNIIGICDNHGYYDWQIPSDFSGFTQPDFIIENNENFSVLFNHEPVVRMMPDISTGIVGKNDICIIDGGYFINSSPDIPDGSISGIFSWTDAKNNMYDEKIYLEIKDHKLIIPEKNDIFTNDDKNFVEAFKYLGKLSERHIDIYISDTTDNTVYTTIKNFTVM